MIAAEHNIHITTGKTWRFVATWKNPDGTPVNLTNRTIRMQMRRDKKSDVTIVDYDSDVKGGITKNNATGQFTITMPAEVSAEIDISEAVFEIDSTTPSGGPDPDVDPLIEGRALIDLGVIR